MQLKRFLAGAIGGIVVAVSLIVPLVLLQAPPARATQAVAEPNVTTSVYLPIVLRNAPAVVVSMQNIAYDPKTITVTVGTTVVWTNNESGFPVPHTVTSGTPGSPDGNFDSSPPPAPALSPGQSFQFVFNTAGTFPYYCRIHGVAMTGTVNVLP